MNIDNLVISYLDVEANKSILRKEIASILKILPSDISDIWYEPYYDGTVHQRVYVDISCHIPKKDLMNLDFDYIEDGFIVFEAGEIML